MTSTTQPSGRDLLAPAAPHIEGVRPATVLLVLVGAGAVGLGLLFLSEATTGIGLIAAGCFLAIVARIAQASSHHRSIMRAYHQRGS